MECCCAEKKKPAELSVVAWEYTGKACAQEPQIHRWFSPQDRWKRPLQSSMVLSRLLVLRPRDQAQDLDLGGWEVDD
jgi:hypothetical protein